MKYEALKKALCKELEKLDDQLKAGGSMSNSDIERVDVVSHALKSLATYEAMAESEESGMDVSERRGRGMNGRYVSRYGGGPEYDAGYSRGYSEAMRGRYPMEPNW